VHTYESVELGTRSEGKLLKERNERRQALYKKKIVLRSFNFLSRKKKKIEFFVLRRFNFLEFSIFFFFLEIDKSPFNFLLFS